MSGLCAFLHDPLLRTPSPSLRQTPSHPSSANVNVTSSAKRPQTPPPLHRQSSRLPAESYPVLVQLLQPWSHCVIIIYLPPCPPGTTVSSQRPGTVFFHHTLASASSARAATHKNLLTQNLPFCSSCQLKAKLSNPVGKSTAYHSG